MLAWLRAARSPRSSDPVVHVLVPSGASGGRAGAAPLLAESAGRLVAALESRARELTGRPATAVLAEPATRRLWCAATGAPLEPFAGRRAGLVALFGAAVLVLDDPPVQDLLAAAARHGCAWCGSPSTQDAYAFAFARGAVGRGELWEAIGALVTGADAEGVAELWRGRPVLLPDRAWPERSPALAGIAAARARRAFDSPRFLNAALGEIIGEPVESGAVGRDPARMAAVLAAQRDVSRVPWVFNALVNAIEYRLGRTEPASFPPEVHLSITGLCNIECRFCAYEHRTARADTVDAEQVMRLDFLRHAQTFRLHSGLGEPTANRHLPDIVERVAGRFPHLGMNFFTNAVTLGGPRLLAALVGRVRWINASLNAATPATWAALCGADRFASVCSGLAALHARKRAERSLLPLVFGSMVVTRANVGDLSAMPALCRRLGVDRFTALPYFGLGYHAPGKFGPDMTLEACRTEYDAQYEATLREAERHAVSVELPLPAADKQVAFGLERRVLHDFARVESNEWKLGHLVGDLDYGAPPGQYCPFLWRSAGIASAHRGVRAAGETHHLYPCLGPLSSLDLSERAAFRFPAAEDFLALWRNDVFTLLRRAQREPGVSPVCDVCRSADTRDPRHFVSLERLVAEFARAHCAPDSAADAPAAARP